MLKVCWKMMTLFIVNLTIFLMAKGFKDFQNWLGLPFDEIKP